MLSQKIPIRSEVAQKDKWNLDSLFPSIDLWKKAVKNIEQAIKKAPSFKGSLHRSAQSLRAVLDFQTYTITELESVIVYATLRYYEDISNQEHLKLYLKSNHLYSDWEASIAFFIPEIQKIDEESFQHFLEQDELQNFSNALRRIRRFRPYSLNEREEWIMALSQHVAKTPRNSFEALTSLDFDFGTIDLPQGTVPLTHSRFVLLLRESDRNIRKKTYQQFYQLFDRHKNILSNLLAADIQHHIFSTRVRKYPSVRFEALFEDNIEESVYDTLIKTVHDGLGHLHDYYALRAKTLHLPTISHYDVYVPLISAVKKITPYQEAVQLVHDAMLPLGSNYCDEMRNGLLGTWVDRYENKGKIPGAFSSGSYTSDPYILLNYQQDNIDQVFTLAHEAGHSMHSKYACAHNPIQDAQYSIFEAEIASTLHEQLLNNFLLKESSSQEFTLYLINLQIDSIIGTLYRQTMFAEFEKTIYEHAQQAEALTLDFFRDTYAKLQQKYFGHAVDLSDFASLECLRIPHFYKPFYVYKYATGISYAISIAEKITHDSNGNTIDQYLQFLKNGGRKFPIDNVSTLIPSTEVAVQTAIRKFADLVATFKEKYSLYLQQNS